MLGADSVMFGIALTIIGLLHTVHLDLMTGFVNRFHISSMDVVVCH